MFVCHMTLLYLILLYKITNKRKKKIRKEKIITVAPSSILYGN